MKQKLILRLLPIVVFAGILLFSWRSVAAQAVLDWATARPITFYIDLLPPELIADQNYTVHAFNDEAIEAGGDKVINYRQWNLDSGWSQPVDILLPNPTTNTPLQSVILDSEGKFDLIYYGGSIESGDIFFTRAWASEASRSTAWEEPYIIGPYSHTLPDAVIKGNDKGELYVLYVGIDHGLGIYEVHSNDGGDTWTEPIPVTFVVDQTLFPSHIELSFDKSGNLHAVWSEMNDRGLGEKVYYANKAVDGSWSVPFLIAVREGNDYAVDWASIIEYNDELILMYMDGTIPNGIPPTRWMRLSEDGGRTWSEPVQPFPHVGENGIAVMVIDSSNQLHVLLANRVGNPAVGGMWHGVWLGNAWSELEMMTAKTPQEGLAEGGYAYGNAASRPNAVISQGNVILSAWWHNMLNAPPAAFSYALLDAPALPSVPLPAAPTTSPNNETAAIATATAVVTQTPTPSFILPDSQKLNVPDSTSTTSTAPLFMGVILASVVILASIISRKLLRSN